VTGVSDPAALTEGAVPSRSSTSAGTGFLAGGRVLRAVLATVFLMLVAWQASVHAPLMTVEAPYESWDEIATYNTARVVSGPTANWAYRYGTLDTFIQIVANQYFILFDPLGAEFHHFSYSNNDYGSLNDEFYVYTKLKPGELGYSYYRGLDDHRPIGLSRLIHFYLYYGLVAGAGVLWIVVLGIEAVWLIVPMLCLTVNREAFLQPIQALPNAINVILCFVMVTLIGVAIERRRIWLLYLAAVALALAMNFKIDVAPLGVVLAAALIWAGAPQGPVRTAWLCLSAFGVFLMVLVATNPVILIAPQEWVGWLLPPVVRSEHSMIRTLLQNLLTLARGLKSEMLPDAWQYYVPTLVVPTALVAGAIGVAVVLRRGEAGALRPLMLPGFAVVLLWVGPLALAGNFYRRYELNGLAALYALIGIALLGLRRHRPRPWLAAAMAAVLIGQYYLLIGEGAVFAAQTAQRSNMVTWGVGNAGYSIDESRNIIEGRAIDTVMAGGYDPTILVDQHAYLDLRPLRLAGLVPVYVNIDTVDAVLDHLDRSIPHLLLLSPGSYDTDPEWWQPWMGTWPADLEQRYDGYLAKLSGFPVLADTGGPAQHLLWAGPVDRHDRMVLAAVPSLSTGGDASAAGQSGE
jgi:hypothetical protein